MHRASTIGRRFRAADTRPGFAWCLLALLAGLAIALGARAAPGRYLEVEDFLDAAFEEVPEQPQTLFVDAALRERIEAVLGHRFARLRLRYWAAGERTAWILDEIGKTEPITIGVVIDGNEVSFVRILEFRESRGWEVRFPFFTDQYVGAGLDDDSGIDRSIDGITGATLSVAAVEKVVRSALIFHEQVRTRGDTASS